MKSDLNRSIVDRRKKILSLLAENGQVYVQELSQQFSVSEVTIRNDLDQLEKKNQLFRARGGAIKIETNVAVDKRLADKSKLNHHLKARIGIRAAELINESDTIILDSGTTTAEVAKNLSRFNNLTVITNAINIVNLLATYSELNIIVPGGYLRKNSLSMVGPLAEKSLRHFFVDKLFIGVDGFHPKDGAYTPNFEEAFLNRTMIEISKEVILVTDSSKFKRKSLAFICPVSDIDIIITDDEISTEDRKRLEEAGIKIIIA